MCYYVGFEDDLKEVEIRYGVTYHRPQNYWDKKPPNPSKMISGFANPYLPIVKLTNSKKLLTGQWGLVPKWAANDISGFRKKTNTLNAMIEEVTKKPSYRNSVENRCLIPVNEFYEYKWLDPKGKSKLLHKIQAIGKDLFSLAGLYETIEDPYTGDLIDTYTILTTEANTLMAEIHNNKKRMPVVLHKEEEELWLKDDPLEHYFCRKEIELEATPLFKPGQTETPTLF